MIVVAVILIFSGLPHFEGGISGFFSQLAGIDPALVKPTNPSSPLFRDFYEIAFAQIVIGIAVVCQPHIITKSLLLKNEADVNKFLITSIVVELLFFSVIIAGLYARLEFPDLTLNGQKLATDSIIPSYVVKVFSNGLVATLVGLLVILGLVSAGMEQTVYLEDYGHLGQIDQILSLHLGLQQKRISKGTIVSMIAAGIGYAWGANVIRWG